MHSKNVGERGIREACGPNHGVPLVGYRAVCPSGGLSHPACVLRCGHL